MATNLDMSFSSYDGVEASTKLVQFVEKYVKIVNRTDVAAYQKKILRLMGK